ncbi:MAG: alcohol dehydrogenase catalytic domain-containing protein [Anaerolineae bacterium]|nr:alcohol dehydrogenase catalytic domain-containing protein [Anaerolineae bacterium]NUQ05906.1 alcohol dehydrogenase catalytic domain-containing protein [Anaerolineae bacterium]
MKAVRLHGPRDLRVDALNEPGQPGTGDVLLRVGAVGICGSDLHMVLDGRIGDTVFTSPLVIGHEFMGTITAVGEGALDGSQRPLRVGQRVAVDPSTPCGHCEICERGYPNLCPNHTFYGVYPTPGALQECMIVHGQNCFPIPDSIGDGAGTLLETLGVAIHAVDLGKLRVAETVAVIGCGPVGMLIVKLALLAGSSVVYAFDKFPWRVEKAQKWGAQAYHADSVDPLKTVMEATGGRGVDVAFEAGWADESVQLAADMARCGGRLVLVGIPGDDRLYLRHSTARRKGLTIRMSRRMKHTYPRAIRLATSGAMDLDDLISETVPLDQAPTAFDKNLRYEAGVQKIIIKVT